MTWLYLQHAMRRNVLAIVLTFSVFFIIVLASPARGYLLKDDKRGTQLSIFGLSMLRLNYAFEDGNIELFESTEDGFPEGFDHQEFLSLTANGILFRNYALEGEVHYNQDDDPDWNFFVKLAHDDEYLLFGDQPNIFQDPYFTRYTSPFRGLTLHGETERVGFTSFGAISRGSTQKEELLPNGTSGPYTLEAVPVVPGSDMVTLEIRSRHDPQTVLERRPQERNVDYTIDYDTGEITFADPVDSETFQGDPIVIVVIYRSETESSAFNTAVMGTRLTVAPTSWAQVGLTYVSEFDRDPSLSDGFDARQEVYGVDSTITLGETWRLTAEYAFSQDHLGENGTDAPAQALRTELQGRIGENIEVQGRYRRAERDFLTFANPDIDVDEQQLELISRYAYHPDHVVTLGYNFTQDNLPQDSATPTTTTHRPFLEWEAQIRQNTELFSKYEYIRIIDDASPKTADKTTHAFLVGGIQEWQQVRVLKKLILRGEYQFSDTTDEIETDEDLITHQLGVRMTSEPAERVSMYVEQRERWIHDKTLQQNTERQDISEIAAELKKWERASLQSKYQYRSTYDLLREQQESERHTLLVNTQYKPFDELTSAAKLEVRDETTFASETAPVDAETQTLNLEGRLTYTPKKDFTARLRYEYEQTENNAEENSTSREDTTELRLNYAFDKRRTRLTGIIKVERDLLETPPTPETETRKITYLASGARQLSERWDVLAQYKRETTDLSTDNFREDVLGEIGYKAGRFLKFVSGYQYTRFRDDDEPDNDYTANSFYIKIIGKL